MSLSKDSTRKGRLGVTPKPARETRALPGYLRERRTLLAPKENTRFSPIMRIFTIGHSTRNVDDFISLLEGNGIKLLADVRLLPGSKRHPQFNKEALAESLSARGIRYVHFPELGGRRKPNADSRNTAWHNPSFRGYADYMETEQFHKGVERLLNLAREAGPTAIMCAEAVWWRCHRALISDYLKAREIEVMHILDANKVEPHPFTSAARIVKGQLSYGAESLL
jgi:uncharacterized protein (DUF488 family)